MEKIKEMQLQQLKESEEVDEDIEVVEDLGKQDQFDRNQFDQKLGRHIFKSEKLKLFLSKKKK